MNWDKAFAPASAQGWSKRVGQGMLGDAVIKAFANESRLIGQAPVGTGKSLAYIIPLFVAILEGKKKGKNLRGVISTETLSLQTQLFEKDMPTVEKLYPGLTWCILKGRSNYLCFNQANNNARGSATLSGRLNTLLSASSSGRLEFGERWEVESVLGYALSTEDWAEFAGSSKGCGDFSCQSDECYGARARTRALNSDIVVVNHAIIQIDTDMKLTAPSPAFAEGMLGTIDFLVIDEAHALSEVLRSGWSESLNEWELVDMASSISKGIQKSVATHSPGTLGREMSMVADDLKDVLTSTMKLFGYISEKNGEKWIGSSHALSEKNIAGTISQGFSMALNEYEVDNVRRLEYAQKSLETVETYLTEVLKAFIEQEIKGRRDVSKGLRATKKLRNVLDIFSKAMKTPDGIVFDFGINYGVRVDGWERRDGQRSCTIHFSPLDISSKAAKIWEGPKSVVLCSGTLVDPVENSFRFVEASLGFKGAGELRVPTPFDFHANQRVYITPGNQPKVDGTQFSMNELTQLINVARGRTLVLCTSIRELDIVASQLRYMQATGAFKYNLLVQDKTSDKQKLADEFRRDTHSVLIGLKSFFVGVNFEGDTLSLLAFPRFPLARLSVEMRQMITVWRNKGFPNFYAMKSLEDFAQGAGRLIRTVTDRGVVALLDQRVMDASSNVCKTAKIGVDGLGSPITQSISDVQNFYSSV